MPNKQALKLLLVWLKFQTKIAGGFSQGKKNHLKGGGKWAIYAPLYLTKISGSAAPCLQEHPVSARTVGDLEREGAAWAYAQFFFWKIIVIS